MERREIACQDVVRTQDSPRLDPRLYEVTLKGFFSC